MKFITKLTLPTIYFNTVGRTIHLSSVCLKLPPFHRLKATRVNIKSAFQKTKFVSNDLELRDKNKNVSLPIIVPKYPPGKWGSMNSSDAWNWHRKAEALNTENKSVFKYTEDLYHHEYNLWYHNLQLPLKVCETLEYFQYITRTMIMDSLPNVYSKPSSDVVSYIEKLVRKHLANLQSSHSSGSPHLLPKKVLENLHHDQKINKPVVDLMETIYTGLAALKQVDHLHDVHIDERTKLETCIKRGGYDTFEREEADFTVKDENNLVKYRIRAQNAWQMRSRDPLPQFIHPDDPLCHEGEIPVYNFHPEDLDLTPVDCFRFDVLPQNNNFHSSEFARYIAGHWGRSPFWEGDPCEFGLLGAINSRREAKFNKECSDSPLVLSRYALSEGIMSAFAWTSAQAYNQGYSFYNELKRPFTSQYVLTDGKRVQILAYQLNSLTALWKPEDAGLPYNMAWKTPEESLYEEITDSGEVIGFNRDVLEKIIQCFLLLPEKLTTDDIRHPYLKDDPAPRDVHKFLSLTTDEEEFEGRGEINLAPFEKKAPKFNTPRRPHPNDVYYFKLTNRRGLLEEIRETFPNLAILPEPYKSRMRQRKKQISFLRGRYKSVKPPIKYQ